MPILVDFSPVITATAFVICTGRNAQPLDTPIIRHAVLASLKKYITKFNGKYGKMILCMDSGDVWRKKVFPLYKANRSVNRDDSSLDWKKFYEIMTEIKQELRDFMPYKIVEVPHAEADDIIAVLAKKYSNEGEPVLIISGDKDFKQLQIFPGVEQWSNVKDSFIVEPFPHQYLIEHIIRGDGGDGVPNILSDDDSIVDPNKQQKRMTSGRLDFYMKTKPSEYGDAQVTRNFYRNKQMVDLIDSIPEGIADSILMTHDAYKPAHPSRVMTYFSTFKLKQLLSEVQNFIEK